MSLCGVKPKTFVLEPGELPIYQQATESVLFEFFTKGVEPSPPLADDRSAKETLAPGIGGEQVPGNLFRPLGVDNFRTKLLVYVIAAFGTSAIGALIYLTKLRITPSAAFDINWTTTVIFIVVIGGIGTIEGPIIGTIVFFLLREPLAEFGSWYLMLLGATAVVIMLKAPEGLWGLIARRYDLHFFPVQRQLRWTVKDD